MARTLVIGYGNPLLSDDGFGWKFAQALREVSAGEDLDIITCHQLGPELAEIISTSQFVLFADASATGVPGEIEIQKLEPASHESSSTHHLTPAALLSYACTLYGARPTGMLVTVTGARFDTGDALSPAVTQALPAAVARARTLIAIASAQNASIFA